jgi:drug/metabolite transporter (DMT)-like permease
MNSVLLHVLILWAVLAAALGLLWLFRALGVSLAPLPYAGVFGFIGAAFGVVLGLTVFFASQHYMTVRTAAQGEATQLATVSAMSGAFPARAGSLVRRDVYCYVTDVIDDEWPAMEGGDERGSSKVDARLGALYGELLEVGRPKAPEPSTWYSSAVSAAVTAAQERGQRLLLGARAQIPDAMWVLIYFGAALMVGFALFFHMQSRRQLVWMTVAVIIMLTVLTGVLAALDHPTQRPFGIGPDAMRILQPRLSKGLGISPTLASSAAKC